jgi:hypothetical protein
MQTLDTRSDIPLKRKNTTWRIQRQTIQELRKIKENMGVSSYEDVVRFLLERFRAENGDMAIASYSRIFTDLENRPVVISGKSGSGKTTAVKQILEKVKGSLFLIDVHSEYLILKRIDLGRFYTLNFAKARCRFVPNQNAQVGNSECSAIFQHLLMQMHSQKLKQSVIVVEEGHRFAADSNLRALIIEARKFIRKLVIVCSDSKLYGDLAPTLYPASVYRK